MRISPRLQLAALAVAVLFLAGPDALAQTPATISVTDVFTYTMPPGWAQIDLPGSSYPTAIETAGSSENKAMITVNADVDKGELEVWCAASLARTKPQFDRLGAQMGDLEKFTTATGAIGYRAPVDLTARGRPIHYVMYFLNGGSGTKLTFTCACPATDAPHYAPLFEAAMKTVVPK